MDIERTIKESIREAMTEFDLKRIDLDALPDTILNGKQACDLIGCSYPTLTTMISDGLIENFSEKGISVSMKQCIDINIRKLKYMRHRAWKVKNGYETTER